MILWILRWLGLIKPENHFTPELEKTVAAIFIGDAYRQECGYPYSSRRLQAGKSPWRASVIDQIT